MTAVKMTCGKLERVFRGGTRRIGFGAMGWLRDVDALRGRRIKHHRSARRPSQRVLTRQFLWRRLFALTTHFVSRCSRFTTGLIFPPVLSLELYELTFAQVFFSNSCFVFANAHKSLKLLLPHWEYEITGCF